MIISPAILVSTPEDLQKQMQIYSEFAEYIDIDINLEDDDFEGQVTVGIDKILEIIWQYSKPNISFHLMVEKPLPIFQKIHEFDFRPHRIYLHQEADIENIPISEVIGITLKAETPFNTIGYYNQFAEVQLMTIETGQQGNPFKMNALERSNTLIEKGYVGKISIDGGVNAETAQLIKNYPIDKVSVGSFLSKSSNPKEQFDLLNSILNN